VPALREEIEMTQYMVSVFMVDDEMPTGEELEQSMKDVDVLNDELKAQGGWVFAGGLHAADTATVLRVKDGDVVTIDGPYAETKEQVAGFWVIEAPDLDAALAFARRATVACRGPIEVRPFQDEPTA
jgi:hypothetical protein